MMTAAPTPVKPIPPERFFELLAAACGAGLSPADAATYGATFVEWDVSLVPAGGGAPAPAPASAKPLTATPEITQWRVTASQRRERRK